MAWGWTAVCEGCDYEWEQLRDEDEPPEICPLCDSTELVVIGTERYERYLGNKEADAIDDSD